MPPPVLCWPRWPGAAPPGCACCFLLVLPLLAARWVWSTGQFVQMRMLMGEPWHRLAVILLTVALLTALATWPLLREGAQQRYHKGETTAHTQLAALFLCLALLLPCGS